MARPVMRQPRTSAPAARQQSSARPVRPVASSKPKPARPQAAAKQRGPRPTVAGFVQALSARIRTALGGQSMLFNLILGAMFVTVSYGLLMVLSASSIAGITDYGDPMGYFWRQAISATVGLGVLIFTSTMTVEFYYRMARTLFAGAIFLQVLVYVPGIGIEINGNRGWIRLLFGFTLQPSEFIKLGLVLLLATMIARQEHDKWDAKQFTWFPLLWALGAIALIILGKDMGTSLVVAIIAVTMIWLAGAPALHLRGPLVLAGVAVVGLLMSSPSRYGRIIAWMNQFTATDTSNDYAWQSQHGIWALANSHIIGQGLGMSSLKWSWIPEVQNDYIFAVIGEEMGIQGAIFTILLYVALGYWILQVANRARDTFSRMVCLGIGIWIVLQALINIAVVLQVLPVLGVPLPLISYGGSSLIAGMAALGVVLSVERRNHAELDGGMRRPVRSAR